MAKMIAFIPSAFSDTEGVGVFHLPHDEVTPYCTGRVGHGHLKPGETSLLQADNWESGNYFRLPPAAEGKSEDRLHQRAKKEALLDAMKRAGWNYSS
mgnify:CR=1 FL=1